MPPTSSMRKTTTATTTTVTHVNDPTSAPRRTTSGRAVRANTTRPTNYYARPFASTAADDNDVKDNSPPGFFPAIQYFTDAITAVPREVVRQFTLMKEVEAKIHGPNEQLGEMLDEIMQYPVPSRQSVQTAAAVGNGQALLSFTANNSVSGSTAPSLINGGLPHLSTQNSMAESVNGEEAMQVDSEEELAKRRKYHELRMLTHNLLANLDEKNVVLAEANRVLSQQLSRIDSVMPHIDNELSEEARLGSMTHWAYSDNRQKKTIGGAAARGRDVAATNSLAAAASAIHESDIAQARRDAVRDTAREKHKGRAREHVDSDFDDKPTKKTHAKIAKNKALGQAAGLGITANGEPVKKRKIEKGVVTPAIERSASSVTKTAKGVKETQRGTPTGETAKKNTKPRPAPLPAKRKGLTSTNGSPAVVSSPLQATFNAEMPGNARPQSARLRNNSTTTNLRHEQLADDEGSRPTSAPHKANGEKTGVKRKAPENAQDGEDAGPPRKTTEKTTSFKHEDAEMADTQQSRSTSNSGKAGQGSKTGTPRNEQFADVPALIRARSMRSVRGNHEDSSSEPQSQGFNRHKRNSSHLIKQLAPFNRSPNMDRVGDEDEMDEGFEGLQARARAEQQEHYHEHEQEEVEERERERKPDPESDRSPRKRRRSSRRNTGVQLTAPSPPASDREAEVEAEVEVDEDAIMEDRDLEADLEEAPDLDQEPAREESPQDEDIDEEEEDDDDDETGDPDDPNEPKYCYCNRGSYGEMIACDNEECPREWFHLGCTELREPPDEEEKWYCVECKPFFVVMATKGRGKGGRGGKR